MRERDETTRQRIADELRDEQATASDLIVITCCDCSFERTSNTP
jgi:hypothetical protein